MASMQDIATRLGISKGTVSLVISGKSKGRVSDAMRQRVLAAAREMNYQPNETARSLRTGRTRVVGVVVPDSTSGYFGRLAYCIQEEAKKFGYLVATANSNESDAELSSVLSVMISRQVDGIIVVPTEHCLDTLGLAVSKGIPLVQLDRQCAGVKADFVGVNNYGMSVRAVKSMLDRGCRHVGMVGYGLDVSTLRERRRGCLDVLRSRDALDMALVRDVAYASREEDMRQAMHDLLSASPALDALYFTSWGTLIDGLHAAWSLGIGLPDTLRLLCFGDADAALAARLHIRCVRQPVDDMGTRAFDLLMDKMNGGQETGDHLFEAYLQ